MYAVPKQSVFFGGGVVFIMVLLKFLGTALGFFGLLCITYPSLTGQLVVFSYLSIHPIVFTYYPGQLLVFIHNNGSLLLYTRYIVSIRIIGVI